jgi:hypothetical protein
MKIAEKIAYLMENHPKEWREAHTTADTLVSSQCAMWCVCGKLCTGLHERTCARFKNKVNSEAAKQLKHLLPRKG